MAGKRRTVGEIVFDPIFTQSHAPSQPGEPALVVADVTVPRTTSGAFGFWSAARCGTRASRLGDMLAWQEICFPYAPDLIGSANLKSVPIQRDATVASHDVEEIYRCDATGVIEVTIADQTTEYARTFRVRESGRGGRGIGCLGGPPFSPGLNPQACKGVSRNRPWAIGKVIGPFSPNVAPSQSPAASHASP